MATGSEAGTYNMNLEEKAFTYEDVRNIEPTFEIAEDGQLDITKRPITDLDINLSSYTYDYDQTDHTPKITVVDPNIEGALDNVLFNITGDLSKTNAGNYVITIAAPENSNYTGSTKVE